MTQVSTESINQQHKLVDSSVSVITSENSGDVNIIDADRGRPLQSRRRGRTENENCEFRI